VSWVRFRAQLDSITPAAEGQHVARFRSADALPAARPGQFVQLSIPSAYWPRPFSLLDWAAGPGGTAGFSILFSEAGPATRALALLPPGSVLEAHGPLGRPFPDVSGPTWMVAGGYGVAPLLWAARRAPSAHPARIFYGAARSALLWRATDLEAAAPRWCTDDGSHGFKGTVLDAVRRELDASPARPTLFSCGPMGLLSAVAALARDTGLKAYVSVETLMPCGIGVCRGCALPWSGARASEERLYAMACEDGPVFDSRDLDWEAEAACRI
jgi:dihydroorotate dehydrogenase electron transfer subunit